MARHDAARTGFAVGKSNITKPSPFWRAYLGGSLRPDQMISADVDGDGIVDLLYATSGRITAKRPNDEVIWRTSLLEISSVLGVADFNGDGKQEVLARSSNRAFLFDVKTGAVAWAQPAGEMGTIGGLRIGDLNGDKLPEIYVQECNCCATTSGKTSFAYSFAGGFAAAKSLWSLPSLYCGSSRALAIVDSDGDGKNEIVTGDETTISLLDGSTGSSIAQSGPLGTSAAWAYCQPANVDGVKGDELLCLQTHVGATPSAREVFVLKHDPASTPKLKLLWTRTIGAVDAVADLAPEAVLDLDGDGQMEVIAAGEEAAGVPKTVILDAKSGAELATIPGARVTGTAPQGGGKTLVLTNAGRKLVAHAFARTATPPVVKKWEATDAEPGHRSDGLIASSFAIRTLTVDANGDGIPELVAYSGTPTNAIDLRDVNTGSAIATYKMPSETSPTTLLRHPGSTGFTPITVGRNDGVLVVLDAELKAMNEPGVHVGGYRAVGSWRSFETSPVLGKLDGGSYDAILVPDSRGSLLRLDAKNATNLAGPKTLWRRAFTQAPAIVPNLDGTSTGIACRALQTPLTSPAKHEVVALKADGSKISSHPVDGVVFGDVVAGKLNADGTPDLVFQWGVASDVLLHTRAINATTGLALFSSPPIAPGGGRSPAGFALADWNKDGIDDVIFQGGGTRVYDGRNGSQIANGGPPDAYFLATVYDVDKDGSAEVILHGGQSAQRMLAHNLTDNVWISPTNDKPFPFGAVATCPAGPVFVEGSLDSPSRARIIPMTGASAGTPRFIVLAGGKLYSDEAAAKADGALMGQLTNASVHTNLNGSGQPMVLFGSTDGWLYAVSACSGKLAFAYDFGFAVGEAVFGDTDGDGLDEIVVSVGDGYLYGLKEATLAAPSFVWDTSGPAGTEDIDRTATTTSLSAKWQAVAGAAGYEVAAAGPGVASDWKNVGNTTETTISGLTLTAGSLYTVAVRAVDADRKSADVVSDGVVIAPTGGDAGPDTGADAAQPGPSEGSSSCDCSTDARRTGAGAGLAFAGVFGIVAGLRRRLRRGAVPR